MTIRSSILGSCDIPVFFKGNTSGVKAAAEAASK